MKVWAWLMTLFVAVEHLAILVLEMFFWDHPIGRKIFAMSEEVSAASATLAANQGLYNGFLAAGLIWSFISKKKDIAIFFLSCVIVAGIFGGLTAKASIILTQGLPAAIALMLHLLINREKN